MTLRRWPMIGLADARLAACEALVTVEEGRDPGAEKIVAKKERVEQIDRNAVEAVVDPLSKRHLAKLRRGAEQSFGHKVSRIMFKGDYRATEEQDIFPNNRQSALLRQPADLASCRPARRVPAQCRLPIPLHWLKERINDNGSAFPCASLVRTWMFPSVCVV